MAEIHLRVLQEMGLREHFPGTPRTVQTTGLRAAAQHGGQMMLEAPTGVGKTRLGLTVLRATAAKYGGPVFYVTPTKTLVGQAEAEAAIGGRTSLTVLGRSEYPCDYYVDRGTRDITAQDSPCYMLQCPHRVDQETGRTEELGVKPCEYFEAKYRARKAAEAGEVVICTTAFFLMNRLRVKEWVEQEPAHVVVDEVHLLASVARGLFETTLTDWTLKRTAEALKPFAAKQTNILNRLRSKFRTLARRARRRSGLNPALLKEEEVAELIAVIEELDAHAIEQAVREAIVSGAIDPVKDREELKLLENLIRTIPRTLSSLRYSLPDTERDRKPLNYVVAFCYEEDDEEPAEEGKRRKVRYRLTIKSYYVRPLIRKALGPNVLAMSATIGDPDIVKYETGLDMTFVELASPFDMRHAKIWMPTDTPDLAARTRRRHDLRDTVRRIADAAVRFRAAGHRSLIVVISNHERELVIRIAEERGLTVVSYGNGTPARVAAERFAAGEGDVLVGTAAHYAQGVDLPGGIAPVIFFLRPGWAPPDDPMTQFEVRRYGPSHCWKLWSWRVAVQALQVRGRNIRSGKDIGVCFFVSQGFRKFLFTSLPEWLRPAYVRDRTMEQAVGETLTFLAERAGA